MTATNGSVDGSVSAATGWVGTVSAGRSIGGSVTAGGDIGTVVAGTAVGGAISGTISAGAAIGTVTAFGADGQNSPRTLLPAQSVLVDSRLQWSDPRFDGVAPSLGMPATRPSVPTTATGGSVTASITAGTNISSIVAFGNIAGDITAGTGIDEVWSLGSVAGTISAGAAANIRAWDGVVGTVQAVGNLDVWSFSSSSGNLTSTLGTLKAGSWHDLTGNLSANGRLDAWTFDNLGGVGATVRSTTGAVLLWVGGTMAEDIHADKHLAAYARGSFEGTLRSETSDIWLETAASAQVTQFVGSDVWLASKNPSDLASALCMNLTFLAGTWQITGPYTVAEQTEIAGATLDVTVDTTAYDLLLWAGKLEGAADLTVTHKATWSGGTITGAGTLTIAAEAQMLIEDSPLNPTDPNAQKMLSSRTIVNRGETFWNGASSILASDGTFMNEATNDPAATPGTFYLRSAGNFRLPAGQSSGGINFQNDGFFVRDIDENTTTFVGTFTNAGAISVESGNLRMSGAAFTSSGLVTVRDAVFTVMAEGTHIGRFTLHEGSILRFDTSDLSQDIVLETASTIRSFGNNGSVEFLHDPESWASGKTVIKGTYSVTTTLIAASVNFEETAAISDHTLVQAGGHLHFFDIPTADGGGLNTFTVGKLFLWEGGTLDGIGALRVVEGASLTVHAPVTWHPNVAIINQGKLTIGEAGRITISDQSAGGLGAGLHNEGELNIITDDAFASSTFALPLFNSGTIRKALDPDSGLGGGTTVIPKVRFWNGGIIDVQAGALVLQGEGNLEPGSPTRRVTVAAGAVLAFSGTFAINNPEGAVPLEFQGDGTVQILDGSFNALANMGNLELLGGELKGAANVQRFVWSGGRVGRPAPEFGGAWVNVPSTGTVFISRGNDAVRPDGTIIPLILTGRIYNQGRSAWSGPVRIQTPQVVFTWGGLIGNPLTFSNPPNSFFDQPGVVNSWNALMDGLLRHDQSEQTDTSALASFFRREADANSVHQTNVVTDPNSMARQYLTAYQAANQSYQNALSAADQADPTHTTEAYWDQVTQAEGTFDEAITAAAKALVDEEAEEYQTYLSASDQPGYQQAVTAAFAAFGQQAAAGYVPGSPTRSFTELIQFLVEELNNHDNRLAVDTDFQGLSAETRASFVLDYFANTENPDWWVTEVMFKGAGEPLNAATGNADTLLGRLGTWFTDASSALSNLTPAAIWDGVRNVWDNTSNFVADIGRQIRDNPAALASTILNGIRDGSIVLFNTFTFGTIQSVNQSAQQIVQQSGFFRTIQVAGVFAREIGLTYLTLGAGRLVTQLGTQAVGRLATRMGVSTATQATILCHLTTAQRLMAPLRTYQQLNNLTANIERARQAIRRGDYEGAAAVLGRTVPTVPATVSGLRDTARLAQAAGAFVVNGETAALNRYLQACFAAGTPILWEGGAKSVEHFRPGDRVWARNDKDPHAPVELRPIEQCFQTEADIWHLHVRGQVIRTTAEHPFWVQGRRWTAAKDLQVGDHLVSHDGQILPVEDILDTGERETVYNFRVAEHHTYFVGSDHWAFSVWAHNICLEPVRRTDDRWNERRATNNPQVKIYGTAQFTTEAAGHDTHIDAVVERLARNAPDGSYFVLNRSWRTALGREFVPLNTIGSDTHPDIIFVQALANGRYRIHAFEVLSPGQDGDVLNTQLQAGWDSVIPPTDLVPGRFRSIAIGEFPNLGP